jgi:AcrR family transcriptional regulator
VSKNYYKLERRWGEEQQTHVCAIKDKATRFVRYLRAGQRTRCQQNRLRIGEFKKTHALLRGALVSLIHEKPYDAIAVTEILERANVGRSTFYTHFRDKDELLTSGIHDMLRSVQSAALPSSAKGPERIIRFSHPIFEYHRQHRRMDEARMGAKGRAIIHEHLRRVLTELIADDVRKACKVRPKAAGRIPPDLLVQYVASTFILVLNWWAESRNPLPPDDVNDLFRALTLPTLAPSMA